MPETQKNFRIYAAYIGEDGNVDTKNGDININSAVLINEIKHNIGIKDIIFLVHGMNNDRKAAGDIFRSYSESIRNEGDKYSFDPGSIVVCGVYWPSMVSFAKDDADPVKLPTDAALKGRGLATYIQNVHQAVPNLRLHVTAHSLGTVMVGRMLQHMVESGFGQAIKSVFLIQGAIPHNWFAAGGELASIAQKLGGPIVATRSDQDHLMVAANLAMQNGNSLERLVGGARETLDSIEKTVLVPVRAATTVATGAKTTALNILNSTRNTISNNIPERIHVKILMVEEHINNPAWPLARGVITELDGVAGNINSINTDFDGSLRAGLRRSQPGIFGFIDKYEVYRDRIKALIGTRPAGNAGLEASQEIRVRRVLEAQWAELVARLPGTSARGVYTLNCSNVICGHDNYKVPAIAMAQLVMAGLVKMGDASSADSSIRWAETPASPAQWMHAMWGSIAQKRLDQIAMPGSHDSGAYTVTARLPVDSGGTRRIVGQVVHSNAYGPVTNVLESARDFANNVKSKVLDLIPEDRKIPGLHFRLRSNVSDTIGTPLADVTPVRNGALAEITDRIMTELTNRKLAQDRTATTLVEEAIVRMSRTQALSLGRQIAGGARYFDMRPVKYEGDYYLAHVDGAPAQLNEYLGNEKFLGLVGAKLRTALEEVAEFARQDSHKRELIVLNFSHYADISRGNKHFDADNFAELRQLVLSTVGGHLITRASLGLAAGAPIQLETLTLDQLTSQGRTVLCVFDTCEVNAVPQFRAEPEAGLFSFGNKIGNKGDHAHLFVSDQYSNSNDIAHVIQDQGHKFDEFLKGTQKGRRGMFLLSWTVTQSPNDYIAMAVGDIEAPAKGINRALAPAMDVWNQAGRIGKGRIPNIIYMDFVGVSAADPDDNSIGAGQPDDVMRVIAHLNAIG